MRINLTEHTQINIDVEELKVVVDFTYLAINISVDNSVRTYISARINNAMNSYCCFRNKWKSNVYSLNTILQLFKRSHISSSICMAKLESQQELYVQTGCISNQTYMGDL